MGDCPICIDGRVSVKLSAAGEEIFCMACRGIVKSATLGFIFEAYAFPVAVTKTHLAVAGEKKSETNLEGLKSIPALVRT